MISRFKMVLLKTIFLALTNVLYSEAFETGDKITATDFFDKFVTHEIPLVLPNQLNEMLLPEFDLTATGMARSGIAAISVTDFNRKSDSTTLMDYFRNDPSKNPARIWLHSNLKTKITFPSILRCNPFLDELLFDTIHTYANDETENEDDSSKIHQLKCLIEGKSEFSLVNKNDEDKREQLEMTSQDCVFIPSNWRPDGLKGGHWLTIRWTMKTSGKYCEKEIKGKPTLADRKWPGEGINYVTEKTTDRKRAANEYLVHLIDKYILAKQAKGEMKFELFVDLVGKDFTLVPELPKWNDECTDVAKELFGNLDRNQDGALNEADLKGLEKANLELWAGLIQDRVFDFADIIYDMRVDVAGNLPPNPNIPEAEEFIERTEKFLQEIEEKRKAKHNKLKDEL